MNVTELVGKTLTAVNQIGNEQLVFTTVNKQYRLFHSQSCCESVTIESITGDLTDLVGSPILMAEESSNDVANGYVDNSFTWTFYKFATRKGYVDIRWYGESNGYYSESVDFEEVEEE